MVLENEFKFRKGDKYYFWDLASRGRATTHPMKDWGGVPSNVSSAIQMANGNYYFFKGDSYWRLNKDKIEVNSLFASLFYHINVYFVNRWSQDILVRLPSGGSIVKIGTLHFS